MRNYFSLFSLPALLVLVLFGMGCKDHDRGNSSIRVRMHDMPLEADSVEVEILQVRIHTEEDGWIDLDTQSGIYDLLELQYGVDTLLVPPQDIPSGTVSQIRFILGTENTLYMDGNSYPLSLSSQDESGLKLNLHEELSGNSDYLIIVDFDAEQSIVETGNGTFKLKPVLTATIQ